MCDGLKPYESLSKIRNLRLAAYLAHIRRNLHTGNKAVKKANSQSTPKSEKPIDLVRELYKIVDEYRKKPTDELAKFSKRNLNLQWLS